MIVPALTQARFCAHAASLPGWAMQPSIVQQVPLFQCLFAALDLDGDGKVSLGEVMAGGKFCLYPNGPTLSAPICFATITIGLAVLMPGGLGM